MRLFGRTSPKDEAKALAARDWVQKRDPFAIASLLLGVFSLIELGALVVPGVAGAILGFMALARLRRLEAEGASLALSPRLATARAAAASDDDMPPARTHGRAMAWSGVILSLLSLLAALQIYTHVLF